MCEKAIFRSPCACAKSLEDSILSIFYSILAASKFPDQAAHKRICRKVLFRFARSSALQNNLFSLTNTLLGNVNRDL